MQRILIISFILVLSQLFVQAQSGIIQGQVMNLKTSRGLPFATVRILDSNIGAATDLNGEFIIENIEPGVYNLQISYLGLGDALKKNIEVIANETTFINVDLPVEECEFDAHQHDKRCPTCKRKGRVVPIEYGLVIGRKKRRRVYYAGCSITSCDPNWFCKRDKTKF